MKLACRNKAAALVVTAAAGVHAGPYALTTLAYMPKLGRCVQGLAPRLYGIGQPGHVALTFDDGPDLEGSPAVLEVLGRLGWRATFFMLADMARRSPEVVRQVVAAGHEIGVHGATHRSFLRLPLPVALAELHRAKDELEALSEQQIRWFRPPYGTLSASALVAAHRTQLTPVLWTAWGRDWRPGATSAEVVADVVKGRLDGGTVLLHDSDCTSAPGSWRATVNALPALVEVFTSGGLTVGPLGEHF